MYEVGLALYLVLSTHLYAAFGSKTMAVYDEHNSAIVWFWFLYSSGQESTVLLPEHDLIKCVNVSGTAGSGEKINTYKIKMSKFFNT